MNNDREIMNTVYGKSLEFGKNYRRPIIDIIHETCPDLSEPDQKELETYLTKVRADIERYFSEQSKKKHYLAHESLSFRGRLWIKKNYPWMNNENISHAISQGIYFTKF